MRRRSRAIALGWMAVATLAGCHGSARRQAGVYSATEAAPEAAGYAAAERPGLGTEFGEQVNSRIVHRSFERASSEPFGQLAIFYNDEQGVLAQAEYRGATLGEVRAYTPGGGISVALTDEIGSPLPGVTGGDRTYVVGRAGERYNISIENDTGGRYEIVASVDGLDVVDGEPAAFGKRGYLLEPYSSIVIDGFRTSESTVAAFRFGAVSDSYAARTGDDRNVGVIGVAMFAEEGSQWTTDELQRRETADPFPNRYALPPP